MGCGCAKSIEDSPNLKPSENSKHLKKDSITSKSLNQNIKLNLQAHPLDSKLSSITSKNDIIKEINNKNKKNIEDDIKIDIKKDLVKKKETKINFKELFMDDLSSQFLNLFKDNSKLFYSKPFLEGICNEYGLLDKSKNKNEAIKIYRDGADLKNDYLCMYRLHKIYSVDYKDFNLEKNNNLDKLYLFKCFAYLPYSILNRNYFIFNRINITYDIAVYLDNEDPDFENFDKFMKLLEDNKSIYNLSINDIKLMKLVFKAYFDSSKYKINIQYLNEFLNLEKSEGENAYFESQLKFCNFYLEYFNNNCDKEKIKNIFENLIKSKYYKASFDYGKFLISEGKYDEAKNIIKNGIDYSNQFCLSQFPYILLREIEINNLLSDYNLIKDLLNNIFLSVCFEKFNFSSAFYAIYYLTKHSSKKIEIENDFIKLILEIYKNFEKNVKNTDVLNSFDERYIIEAPFIFGQMCYYGILDNIKPDKEKALIYFKKSFKLSKEKNYIHFIRINYIYKYKACKYLFKNKKINQEKIMKTKNKLLKIFLYSDIQYLTPFELYNYYKLYKNEKIGNSSIGQIISLLKRGINFKMVYNFKDYVYKEKCNKALKDYEKYCNMCYTNQNNIILKPCEHLLCQSCFEKLDNNTCGVCGKQFESSDNVK